MRNKNTALFFILLANIFLLVYAVYPQHHHHGNIVCTNSAHCKNEKPNDHNAMAQDHQHDDTHSNNCGLKQVSVLPANQNRTVIKSAYSGSNFHFDVFFYLSTSGLEAISHRFCVATFFPEIYLAHSSYHPSSLSLRAPPTV